MTEKNRLLEVPADNSPAVTEAFAQLADFAKTSKVTIPEGLFVQKLLPLITAKAISPISLDLWGDLAGNVQTPITVVDNVTGEELFTCPPPLRTLPTETQEELNYSDMLTEVHMQDQVHPTIGDRYLADALKMSRTGATLIDVESARQWNLIRKRYNLPLLTIGSAGTLVEDSATGPTAGGSTGQINLSDDQDDF